MGWRTGHRGLALLLLTAGFVFGLLRLFAVRSDVGDLYPPYSSLRRDPQGTAVLFESLKALPGVTVRRNFDPIQRLAVDGPATLLFLGADAGWIPDKTRPGALLDRLESRGGRLVIAFDPLCAPRSARRAGGCRIEAVGEAGPAPAESDGDSAREKSGPPPGASLAALLEARLKLRIVVAPRGAAAGDPKPASAADQAAGADEGLPGGVAFRGDIRFELRDPSWKVLAHVQGDPVAVERRLGGAGRVVVVADSTPFSNEALSRRRASAFLARLIGPPGLVVFDETHLGLVDVPTIAALIRRHGFHWFLIAAAALLLLGVWQRAAPLVPAPGGREPPGGDPDAPDAVQGWVSLLRRHIGSREIVPLCIDEWSRSAGRDLPAAAEALARIRREAREIADPAAGYRRVGERIREWTSSRREGT